jgi:hypothetical protein
MENITSISSNVKSFSSKIGDALVSTGKVVGLILIGIGLIIFIYQLHMFFKIYQINHWPVIKNGGKITDAYMENSNNNVTYSVLVASSTFYELFYRTRVAFSYELDGKTYNSIKLSYYEPWNNNPMIAKNELDQYKKDETVDIIVNPKNYAEAYIINKPYRTYQIMAIGIALMLIGAYIFYKTSTH